VARTSGGAFGALTTIPEDWLGGSNDDAKTLIRLAPVKVFVAGPDG
jgi:hypothetical protein